VVAKQLITVKVNQIIHLSSSLHVGFQRCLMAFVCNSDVCGLENDTCIDVNGTLLIYISWFIHMLVWHISVMMLALDRWSRDCTFESWPCHCDVVTQRMWFRPSCLCY